MLRIMLSASIFHDRLAQIGVTNLTLRVASSKVDRHTFRCHRSCSAVTQRGATLLSTKYSTLLVRRGLLASPAAVRATACAAVLFLFVTINR